MKEDLIIYMATHNQKCSHIDDYIIPIQVGKALNDEQFEEVTDDTGINISHKNKNFCELTALYWMWKNTNHNYIGLCHYRRRFDLGKNQIISILKNQNIILPKVKKFRMSIEEQYIKEHGKEDWEKMLEILKEYSPGYYEFSKKIFSSNTLYMYNMFIMDGERYNHYCEWLFPLVFMIEEKLKDIHRDKYQSRYMGFLSERLLTLYVQYNKLDRFEADILFLDNKIKFSDLINIINNNIFKIKKLMGRK